MSKIMNHRFTLSLAVAGVVAATVGAGAAAAQQASTPRHHYSRDLPASLVTEARVGEDSASKVAMARVPAGHIRNVELERENGKLIYSYELKVRGRPGVEEVNVNAATGHVVNVEHEGAKAERAEGKGEHEGHDN